MSEIEDLDEEFKPNPIPKKGISFGTLGASRKRKCAGIAGESCARPAYIKSGPLWFCNFHAPRGSEG